MSTRIMKAVEWDKLSASFKKANHWTDMHHSGKYGVQLKYDGCYATVGTLPLRMESRTGEVVRSCDHIIEEVAKFTPPGCVVIGEVWSPRGKFSQISGDFRRHSPSPDLQFMVHDIVEEGMKDSRNYIDRYNTLAALVRNKPRDHVAMVEMWPSVQVSALLGRLESLPGDYDGVMVKDLYAPYTVGLAREGQLIKVKPTLSLDLIVKRCTTTQGDKTGRDVHVLTVEYKGVPTDVGSGVPHELDPLEIVGSIVEVECLGVLPSGKLREPRFKAVRHDKEEPDK